MNTPNNNQNGMVIGIVVGVLALLCCCLVALGAAGYAFYQSTTAFATTVATQFVDFETPTDFDTPEPRDTPEDKPTPSVNLTAIPTPVENNGETLNALQDEIIPES